MFSKRVKVCCDKKNAIKYGCFRRVSDGRWIQRYRCKTCKTGFSQASYDSAYRQKKRQVNYKCLVMLSSMMSLRRTAIALSIHPITVARKLVFLAQDIRQNALNNPDFKEREFITAIQIDELQTIEHTKLKPVSVVMAVSEKKRQILGFRVSRMPATGHLAVISRKKYGKRPDHRKQNLQVLCQELKEKLNDVMTIRSDECPFYESIITDFFPKANYCCYKGQKSRTYGQGELKRGGKDPLFSINHTFAMLRANINRLIRKTWCTTKKLSRLEAHLTIYMWFHNTKLTPA